MLHTVKRIKAGESVLIYAAAGGVGTAVIQLGKLAGIKMIGLTSTDEKANIITSQGIDHVINYKKENVVERVLEITAGKGVDLILDCVGGPAFGDNFKMMNSMGHLIWFGIAAGNPSVNLLSERYRFIFKKPELKKLSELKIKLKKEVYKDILRRHMLTDEELYKEYRDYCKKNNLKKNCKRAVKKFRTYCEEILKI